MPGLQVATTACAAGYSCLPAHRWLQVVAQGPDLSPAWTLPSKLGACSRIGAEAEQRLLSVCRGIVQAGAAEAWMAHTAASPMAGDGHVQVRGAAGLDSGSRSGVTLQALNLDRVHLSA